MFPMQERLFSLSSLLKNLSIISLGVLFSCLKEKNLFTEGTDSFLAELLLFGKGLKTREMKSSFVDHGQVNSNLLG